MIRIVKRKLAVEKELLSKIEWACTFSNCEPKIKNGNLRILVFFCALCNNKKRKIYLN